MTAGKLARASLARWEVARASLAAAETLLSVGLLAALLCEGFGPSA